MKNPGVNNINQKLLQFTSAALMCACLLLLTGANFVVYPSENISSVDQRNRESKAPPTPTEEKSGETKPPASIQEEYLHDHADVQLRWINNLSLHKIHAAEKLPLPPGREVYCPPRFC